MKLYAHFGALLIAATGMLAAPAMAQDTPSGASSPTVASAPASASATADLAPASPAVTSAPAAASSPGFNGGDTAWMLISTVLVTLMVVPGIALFYAGMVRRKNALAITAQVLGSAAVVTLVWVASAYSLAFSTGSTWLGDFSRNMLSGISAASTQGHLMAPSIPEPVFVLFQLAFAMVTVALVLGAVVERFKFGAAMAFAALWTVLVYAPVAHWIWHPNGWLHRLGHLDYAGGTVVHLAAGMAGLVLAGLTGPRRGYGTVPMPPHNLMLTVTGAGLLWVGWFGFNGGSALEASSTAAMAVMATQVAASTGVIGWIVCEWIVRGRITLLGVASGLVAGLIAITPASGFVGVGGALIIGVVAGVFCFFAATAVKARLGYDDSLDVFGLHGVAGFLGTVLTGVFQLGSKDIWHQTWVQTVGALAVAAYVAAATLLIGVFIKRTLGLRVDAASEEAGLDLATHGETLEG